MLSSNNTPKGVRRPTGLAKHISNRIGACHYCGFIGNMTKDHVQPRYIRRQGPENVPHLKVDACEPCNQRKNDKTYEEFRSWLLTDDGYWYLHFRHLGQGREVRPCEVLPMEGFTVMHYIKAGERERHFCAAHKPCGVLRRRMIVIGDGRSVWDDERIADGQPPGRRRRFNVPR